MVFGLRISLGVFQELELTFPVGECIPDTCDGVSSEVVIRELNESEPSASRLYPLKVIMRTSDIDMAKDYYWNNVFSLSSRISTWTCSRTSES